MVASVRNWWDAHSLAERVLMAMLGTAILIVLLWLGVWRPVEAGIAAGWERQGAAVDRYGIVRSRVETLKEKPAEKPSETRVPVEQIVSQTAAEAGFTLERVGSPGGGRMSVSIPSARSAPLLGWIAQLENGGVQVQTISIVPGTTAGTLAVQAVFAEGGQ